MVITNENNHISTTVSNSQENMSGVNIGKEIKQNRRVLGVINQNLAGGQAYPCVVNKRSISRKDQPNQIHRPITRKFSSEKSSLVENKKLKPSSNEFGNFIYVEEAEENKADGLPMPMSLEKTDLMEETEMEEISDTDNDDDEEEDEPIIDIDVCDANNPLAVFDYVGDLYTNYMKEEKLSCVDPNYMDEQDDISEKMRSILIDWLIEVHDKFDIMSETLFLTVSIIDRFLSQQQIVRKKLQLVGLVAMLLACKYEEVSVPVVGDLILISDRAYTRNEVLEMEKAIVKTLKWNMSLPTPYVFINRFLKAAQSDKKIEMMSFFLVELGLVDYEMLKYPPSLLAAAAVYTAQCTIYGFRQWNTTCQWHSNYSEQQLLECSRLMVSLHQNAATGKLTGVHRKYSSSKFGYTAKSEPALFLLQTQQD